MWIRTAFWVGAPKPECDGRFKQAIKCDLLPAIKACPGVKDVLALWPRKREDDPPIIACQLIIMFDEQADIAVMLASPQRTEMRKLVPAIVALFDGAVSHINYEVE